MFRHEVWPPHGSVKNNVEMVPVVVFHHRRDESPHWMQAEIGRHIAHTQPPLRRSIVGMRRNTFDQTRRELFVPASMLGTNRPSVAIGAEIHRVKQISMGLLQIRVDVHRPAAASDRLRDAPWSFKATLRLQRAAVLFASNCSAVRRRASASSRFPHANNAWPRLLWARASRGAICNARREATTASSSCPESVSATRQIAMRLHQRRSLPHDLAEAVGRVGSASHLADAPPRQWWASMHCGASCTARRYDSIASSMRPSDLKASPRCRCGSARSGIKFRTCRQ